MKLQFILLIVIGLSVARGKGHSCPLGFDSWGSSCYLFSVNKATYAEANSFCLLFSSHLAVIETSSEDHFLRTKLYNQGQGWDYWIGGTDLRREGSWMWELPNKVMTYKNFVPGQPSNSRRSEHCLEMSKGWGYRWNDSDCKTEQRYICET